MAPLGNVASPISGRSCRGIFDDRRSMVGASDRYLSRRMTALGAAGFWDGQPASLIQRRPCRSRSAAGLGKASRETRGGMT